MKKFIEKLNAKLKKRQMNSEGSSFVMVLVSIALVMIVVAVLFVMIFLQYKMINAGKQSRDNFYYLEEVLNEMRVGIGNQALIDLKKAYDETVAMVVYYDTDDKKYMTVSNETASSIMNNKYFDYIKGDFKLSNADLSDMLLSYVQNVQLGGSTGFKTSNGVEISFDGANFGCEEIYLNTTALSGYRISDVTVSRQDKKGNVQSITTDFIIAPPDDTLNFLASAQSLGDIFTYNIVADYGVEVVDNNNEVRVTGNLYAGSDMRNNGIYLGTVANDLAHVGYSKKIVGAKPGNLTPTGDPKETNDSKYSGIYVSGKGNSLNLQSDIISVNGCITANDGGVIEGNKKSESSNQTAQANLVARNIITSTSGTEGGSKIFLQANSRISDDTELNAPKSDVELRGLYYGYSYAAEEDSYYSSGDANKNQLSAAMNKRHTNSSAILVNGKNSRLDLSGLTDFVVSGRSYIDLLTTSAKSHTADDDSYVDIETADSVSVKSNQLVYRVQETEDIKVGVPSLKTTGCDYAYDAENNRQTLTTKVPTYNLIKFLVYQFFEDNGNYLFKSQYHDEFEDIQNAFGVTGTEWDDMTADKILNQFRSNPRNLAQMSEEELKYINAIMDIYIPTYHTIQKGRYLALRNGKLVAGSPNAAAVTISVTDAAGSVSGDATKNNTYLMVRNDGSLTIKGTTYGGNTISLNRYGFLTCGDRALNLVSTRVQKNNYYYFQFYDTKSREEFVLDYAAYLKSENSSAAAESPLNANLLNDRVSDTTINLPDQARTSYYTSGLATVINGIEKDEYELVVNESGSVDQANVTAMYSKYNNLSKVYMTYFPKAESLITGYQTAGESMDGTMVDCALKMYADGTRSNTTGCHFYYNTSGDAISPLTNPDCIGIDWEEVHNKPASYAEGVDLNWYPGGKVWVSDTSIEVIGSGNAGSRKYYGIVISMGDVTLKNIDEFTGIIICAGKLKIDGNTKLYADEQMCTSIVETDADNQIRTCFGLDPFEVQNENDMDTVSVTSIEYTDLVGYENWTRNGE